MSDYSPGALVDSEGLQRRRLRVLAQCKAERKKFSPRYVREMEGVWYSQSKSATSFPSPLASDSHSISESSTSTSTSVPAYAYAYPTVALLLSESPFAQSTLLHAYRSTVPFLLIHIPSISPSPLSSEPSANTTTSTSTTFSVTQPPELGSVCPNPALSQLVHPLSFRWERNPTGTPGGGGTTTSATTEVAPWVRGRPGLWWNGRKLGSWVPDDGEVISSESSET